MSVQVFFVEFENEIRKIFDRAKAEADGAAACTSLELTDQRRGLGEAKADIYVTPQGIVRVTWCAIASLWATAQAAARILARAEKGRMVGHERLQIASDPELVIAMNLLTLCRRLCLDDLPRAEWVNWAPKPDSSSTKASDSGMGNTVFYGALAWMIRHEIAHITCRHKVREHCDGLSITAMEQEADWQATEWFRGERIADAERKPGTPSIGDERELEFRGFVLGIGLIWVAMFESSISHSGADYPSPTNRLFTCLDQLGLREDSAAAQWLADFTHAWIDPEAKWAPPGGHRDSMTFLNEGVFRLQRYLSESGK
jgi:hypothetical protein